MTVYNQDIADDTLKKFGFATVILLLALLARAYAFVSVDRIFDDAFISLRVMENLANGSGFAYHDGIPLQTSTSVIYTSLGAILCLFLEAEAALSVLRHTAIILDSLVSPGLFLLLTSKHRSSENLQFIAGIFAGVIYSLLSTNVLAAGGGLETGFYTFWIILVMVLYERGNSSLLGLALGLSVLLRPDAGILIVAVLTACFAGRRSREGILQTLYGLVAVLAPYAVFHIWYFPTLLPQTMIAKGLTSSGQLGEWSFLLNKFFIGGPPQLLLGAAYACGVLAIRWRTVDVRAVIVGWGIVYAASFSTFASWWAWYLPPFVISYAAAVGIGVEQASDWLTSIVDISPNHMMITAMSGAVLTASFSLYLHTKVTQIGSTPPGDKLGQQQVVEWINENAGTNPTVMLEKLGYIGFHTDARFYDYPGLASRRVTAVLDNLGRNVRGNLSDWRAVDALLSELKPEFLVVRYRAFKTLITCSHEMSSYTLAFVTRNSSRYEPSDRFYVFQLGNERSRYQVANNEFPSVSCDETQKE